METLSETAFETFASEEDSVTGCKDNLDTANSALFMAGIEI